MRRARNALFHRSLLEAKSRTNRNPWFSPQTLAIPHGSSSELVCFLVFGFLAYENLLLSCVHHQTYALGLFFLPFLWGRKRDIGYFDILNVPRNVTDSMAFATKPRNQNLLVFFDKIRTTIIGYKGFVFGFGFFGIVNQLDPDILPDGRILAVWL